MREEYEHHQGVHYAFDMGMIAMGDLLGALMCGGECQWFGPIPIMRVQGCRLADTTCQKWESPANAPTPSLPPPRRASQG